MLNNINNNQIFIGYATNELEIMRRYVGEVPLSEYGFHIDVFGNKTRLAYFHKEHSGSILQKELPFPDNGQYGEAIEYLGTMRGIEAADESLVVYELGAGFAPWLVVAKTFALHRPTINKMRFVAVEADPARLPLIESHFRDNGMPLPNEMHPAMETFIVNAAVSDSTGDLIFSANDIHDWGGTARSESDILDYRGIEGVGVTVSARKIEDLIAGESRIDLMHIDIQGWEVTSIKASLAAVNSKVASMVIGTHSRVIEGELISVLRNDDWILVYEKPCKFHCQSRLPDIVGATFFDGTQFWINTRLWPNTFNWN